MPFTKFLGIVLGCYAVYYFFIVLIDLIKSKQPAVSADRKSLHSVQYELPERPNIQSEKVSKDTHGDLPASSETGDNTNTQSEKITKDTKEISEEIRGDSEEGIDGDSPVGQFDLDEERKLFDLEHEEVSDGIEVVPEKFNQIASFV